MTWVQRLAWFLGEVARPFSIIATSAGASIAAVISALHVDSGAGGALLMAAIFGGVAGLYWGKSWENVKKDSTHDNQG